MTIDFNIKIWNQQCGDCECFGDKTGMSKENVDKLGSNFLYHLLKEDNI
jgi:hypothetical protein